MKKRQVTSSDVARMAGVSQSAVSRAFTPGACVSEKTRVKVMAAARLLGYKPNAIARSLITQRTNIIGVVIGDTINPFYSEILEETTRRLQAAGRQVMLFVAAPDLDPGEALPQALQYQVDGVVVSTAALSPQMALECATVGTPMVLINRQIDGMDVPSVNVDHQGGCYAAADLLVDAGHRRLAFVNGIQSSSGNEARRRAFLRRVADRGLTPVLEDVGSYTYDGGFGATIRLMTREDRPDGIFCANDVMALGAVHAIRHHLGLRVPEDVSVIGFDDIPEASWPGVSLTTVRVWPRELAACAASMVLGMVDAGTTTCPSQILPVQLIVRSTTRPVTAAEEPAPATETERVPT